MLDDLRARDDSLREQQASPMRERTEGQARLADVTAELETLRAAAGEHKRRAHGLELAARDHKLTTQARARLGSWTELSSSIGRVVVRVALPRRRRLAITPPSQYGMAGEHDGDLAAAERQRAAARAREKEGKRGGAAARGGACVVGMEAERASDPPLASSSCSCPLPPPPSLTTTGAHPLVYGR